ncbi:hypothetical protein [Streptomyces sp. NPDC029004]|uniref:hypothetical protein n=1 Tax=Streptomyces sp. NPDC029004 TaxID=3154490 RepID=UPI0033EFEA5B
MSAQDIARLSTRAFLVRLAGLPSESQFAHAWRTTPRRVSDPDEIARLTGR